MKIGDKLTKVNTGRMPNPDEGRDREVVGMQRSENELCRALSRAISADPELNVKSAELANVELSKPRAEALVDEILTSPAVEPIAKELDTLHETEIRKKSRESITRGIKVGIGMSALVLAFCAVLAFMLSWSKLSGQDPDGSDRLVAFASTFHWMLSSSLPWRMIGIVGLGPAGIGIADGVLKLRSRPTKQREALRASVRTVSRDLAKARRKREAHTAAAVASVETSRAALRGLLDEWAAYELNPRLYFSTPALRDETVPATAEYQTALSALASAVDDLYDGAPRRQIAAAANLAEAAWTSWHFAYDHAVDLGLSGRSDEEQASLHRLGRLVERLKACAPGDPEISAIKARITACLERIPSTPITWQQITALPGLDAHQLREIT